MRVRRRDLGLRVNGLSTLLSVELLQWLLRRYRLLIHDHGFRFVFDLLFALLVSFLHGDVLVLFILRFLRGRGAKQFLKEVVLEHGEFIWSVRFLAQLGLWRSFRNNVLWSLNMFLSWFASMLLEEMRPKFSFVNIGLGAVSALELFGALN